MISDGAGRLVDLLNPKPEDIDIEEVLRGLDRMPRFNGRGAGTVSILRHSIGMARSADISCGARTAALCILHDAHENFTGDIVTPMKNAIGGSRVSDIELGLDAAIFSAAGFDPTPDEIYQMKILDTYAMAAEKLFLGIDPGDNWGFLPHMSTDSMEYSSLMWALRIKNPSVAVEVALNFIRKVV